MKLTKKDENLLDLCMEMWYTKLGHPIDDIILWDIDEDISDGCHELSAKSVDHATIIVRECIDYVQQVIDGQMRLLKELDVLYGKIFYAHRKLFPEEYGEE